MSCRCLDMFIDYKSVCVLKKCLYEICVRALKIKVPAASDNDTTNTLWRLWTSEILDQVQTQRQRDQFRLLLCCLSGKHIHHLLGQRYFRKR